jgi:hypothetical protein
MDARLELTRYSDVSYIPSRLVGPGKQDIGGLLISPLLNDSLAGQRQCHDTRQAPRSRKRKGQLPNFTKRDFRARWLHA